MTGPESSVEPDLITFSTLLKGYCHLGDIDRGLQVVQAIKARGLRCDELVYNTLMDGCVKANDIAAGLGLFEEMVQDGMRPSAITHSILTRLHQRAGYNDNVPEALAQLYQHHGIDRPSRGDRGGSLTDQAVNRGATRQARRPRGGNAAGTAEAPICHNPSESCYRLYSGSGCWSDAPTYDSVSEASFPASSAPPTPIAGQGFEVRLPCVPQQFTGPWPGSTPASTPAQVLQFVATPSAVVARGQQPLMSAPSNWPFPCTAASAPAPAAVPGSWVNFCF
eukprot:NODE_7688_length_1557_cov_10.952448.p1 GENE.NODE_7688_length_1557_cov_10.952448~~NODE_7688_length_1557_cov_10.952448.p1  ORF type:complete len:279 (+),score=58.01 NODE_7688_length_1557_cov_10.952448:542-1378(+)